MHVHLTPVLYTGIYSVLVSIWKKNSGVTLQLINFSFSLGASLAPLMAKPFLDEESTAVNVSCTHLLDVYDSNLDNVSNSSCMAVAAQNCSDESYTEDWLMITCPNPSTLYFTWSYLLSIIPLLLALPGLLLYAVTKQLLCNAHCPILQPPSPDATSSKESESSDEATPLDHDLSEQSYPQTCVYKTVIMTILFLVNFLYVGLEITFGSLIFNYAVRSRLHFSKSEAALLNCAFWSAITLGRLTCIPLAFCMPASVMISLGMTGGLFAVIAMTLYPFDPVAIWLGCTLLGACMAPIRPSTITWLCQHGPSSAKAIAIVLAGGSVGVALLPGAVATLTAYLAPVSLLYVSVIVLTCCSVLWGSLFLITGLSKKCCRTIPNMDSDGETIPLREISRQSDE